MVKTRKYSPRPSPSSAGLLPLLALVSLIFCTPSPAQASDSDETKRLDPKRSTDRPRGPARRKALQIGPELPPLYQNENKSWPPENTRFVVTLGGHLSFPGQALQQTASPLGGGIDTFVGLGPKDRFFVLGIDLGFDWFKTRTERFVYEGQDTYWDLNRLGIWALPTLRFIPQGWIVRPHLDIMGGLWVHDVTIDKDKKWSNDRNESVGSAVGGGYGFATGLYWAPAGYLLGLSVQYLRGGKISVPNVNDVAVIDGVLHYGVTKTKPISQWTLRLEFGLDSPKKEQK